MGNFPPGPKSFIANGYSKDIAIRRHYKHKLEESWVRLAPGNVWMFPGCHVKVTIKTAENDMTFDDDVATIVENYTLPPTRSAIITNNGGITLSRWGKHWVDEDNHNHKPG